MKYLNFKTLEEYSWLETDRHTECITFFNFVRKVLKMCCLTLCLYNTHSTKNVSRLLFTAKLKYINKWINCTFFDQFGLLNVILCMDTRNKKKGGEINYSAKTKIMLKKKNVGVWLMWLIINIFYFPAKFPRFILHLRFKKEILYI